ncbi:hypothetical protein, partial [Nocardia uniformis]|uniref:hypothetical protein n=1 Tax=Nocardia uniformis TaxID=53432 RepID=UPI001BB12CDA
LDGLTLVTVQGEIGFDDQSPGKKMLVSPVPIYIVPRRGHFHTLTCDVVARFSDTHPQPNPNT